MISLSYYINRPENKILNNITTNVLLASKSLRFHRSLENYIPTPLTNLRYLASKYNVEKIYVKDESPRFGLNAFKGLGASYAINEILKKKPDIKCFCTATDGNHGRALSWYSRLAGKNSVVIVPGDTTKSRIRNIQKEGGKVIQINGNFDEACAFAEKLCNEEGYQLVQDTAWENYRDIPNYIMAGYLTPFVELENSIHLLPDPAIDIVFLQAGVGSWSGSAAWYYLNRYGKRRPKIVIVEPCQADGVLESFKKGYRSFSQGNFETIMAGLNCGIPSLNSWDILKNCADVVISIDDSFAETAMKELYYPLGDDEKIISGESGAAGLAGFIAIMKDKQYSAVLDELEITEKSNLLFYSTEGATDPEIFQTIIKA